MPFSTISSWVQLLTRTLDAKGLDSRAICEEAGLDPAALEEPGVRLPARVVGELWLLAEKYSASPSIGIEVVGQWHATSMHALGFSWMASSSLRDAIQRAVRYGRIVTDAVEVDLIQSHQGSWLTLEAGKNIPGVAVDAGLAVLLQMCRELFGSELTPLEVKFRHSQPVDPAPYNTYFGVEVQFDSDVNAILLTDQSLDEHLPTANPDLVRINDQAIVDYLAKFDRSHFAFKTRSALTDILAAGEVTQEQVARHLNVSSRSLQRHLAQEGTSYQQILEDVRNELAVSYLQNKNYSVSDIAYLLGYADSGNFSKAFKRWHGCSPKTWRQTAS